MIVMGFGWEDFFVKEINYGTQISIKKNIFKQVIYFLRY